MTGKIKVNLKEKYSSFFFSKQISFLAGVIRFYVKESKPKGKRNGKRNSQQDIFVNSKRKMMSSISILKKNKETDTRIQGQYKDLKDNILFEKKRLYN